MVKQVLRTAARLLCFTAIFFAIWFPVERIIKYKWDVREHFYDRYRCFEAEPEGSIDILYMGTSRINGGINPAVVFNEIGATGYNFGNTSTTSFAMYYELRYALKHHKPKYLVMELSGIHLARTPDATKGIINASYEKSIYNMPDKKLFFEMLWVNQFEFGQSDALRYMFPLIEYHDRWKKVTLKDFSADPYHFEGYEEFLKGTYMRGDGTNFSDQPLFDPELKPVEAPETNIRYFDKIVALCKENDIEIIVIVPPYLMVHESYYQITKEYCEKNNLPLLYFPTLESIAEFGIDTRTDYYNVGHLNTLGQRKFSERLAQYMKENFEFEDHREDPAYAHWHQAYAEYYEAYGQHLGAKLPEAGAN